MKMKNSILFVTIIFGAFLVNAQEKGTSQINVGMEWLPPLKL